MNDRYRHDKAIGIMRPIDHMTLDEEEIKILEDAVKKIKGKQRKAFDAHLKRVSKMVKTWPKWKQNALNGPL